LEDVPLVLRHAALPSLGITQAAPLRFVVHAASLALSRLIVAPSLQAAGGATRPFHSARSDGLPGVSVPGIRLAGCGDRACLAHILTRPWARRVSQQRHSFQPTAAGLNVLKQTCPRSRNPWTNCCCYCIARYEPAVEVERPIAVAHAHHAADRTSRPEARGQSITDTSFSVAASSQ
jgi:hypothetical protein